jgi:hypothetical protein
MDDASNSAVHGPRASSAGFTDQEMPTGFEHAGHFRGCALGLLNKAKRLHGENAVEALVIAGRPPQGFVVQASRYASPS